MTLKDQPIRRKLTIVILLTSTAVLLLTCAAFVAYEVITFRRGLAENLTTLARIAAENSRRIVHDVSHEPTGQRLSIEAGERWPSFRPIVSALVPASHRR